MELMPEFNSEEEFNEYFKKQNLYCDKFRNKSGELSFESESQFLSFLSELFERDGQPVKFKRIDGATIELIIKSH